MSRSGFLGGGLERVEAPLDGESGGEDRGEEAGAEWSGPDGRTTPVADLADGILRGLHRSSGVDVAAERPRV